MELDESAEAYVSSNRNKLKRITMMIDKEDESMGFLQRGTVYDQQTRCSVYVAENPGSKTRGRIEIVGYDMYGNPVLNHPGRRSESAARDVTWGYEVPRVHYPQVVVDEEQYGDSVNAYDNNVTRNHHRSRHADTFGNTVLNHPEGRSESAARDVTRGSEVPSVYYQSLTVAAEHQVDEEQYGDSVRNHDYDTLAYPYRRDEPTGQPEAGDGNVASDEDNDTLP